MYKGMVLPVYDKKTKVLYWTCLKSGDHQSHQNTVYQGPMNVKYQINLVRRIF